MVQPGSARQLVKLKIAGSNPVGPAIACDPPEADQTRSVTFIRRISRDHHILPNKRCPHLFYKGGELKIPTLSEENKTKASALLAAVLVIAAGYLVYRNFTRVEQEISRKEADLSTNVTNKTGETGEQNTPTITPTPGVVAGAGTTNAFGTGGETNVWQPREIAANSISGNSYTVVSGDTLWEIAKGHYGTGFQWTKILEANKDKIGFLPNGQQALIIPGQVLTLP